MKSKLDTRHKRLSHKHNRDVASKSLPRRHFDKRLILLVFLGEPNAVDPIKDFEVIGEVVLDFEGKGKRIKLDLIAAPRDVCKHIGGIHWRIGNPWHAYLLGKPSHVRALENQDP